MEGNVWRIKCFVFSPLYISAYIHQHPFMTFKDSCQRTKVMALMSHSEEDGQMHSFYLCSTPLPMSSYLYNQHLIFHRNYQVYKKVLIMMWPQTLTCVGLIVKTTLCLWYSIYHMQNIVGQILCLVWRKEATIPLFLSPSPSSFIAHCYFCRCICSDLFSLHIF